MAASSGEFGWFKLDEQYFNNPKVQAVGCSGWSLHLAMCAWSSAHHTDGFVPDGVVKMLTHLVGARRDQTHRLETVTLIHRQDGGWLLHDWEDFIRSKSQVEKERARWRNTKRKQRMSTVDSARDSTEDSTEESRDKQSKAKNYLHPPTTESQLAASSGMEGEVVRIIMKADRAEAGAIKNPAAWERTVTERLTIEHGDRIAKLHREYPTASAVDIAGYLRDGTNSLRYHQRVES